MTGATPDELLTLVRRLRSVNHYPSLDMEAADAIDALLARLAAAEADADRLLRCVREHAAMECPDCEDALAALRDPR